MNLFDLLSQYFWLFCIVVAVVNYLDQVMAVAALPFFAFWLWLVSQMNVPFPLGTE